MLPLESAYNLGPKTAQFLERLGYKTIEEVRDAGTDVIMLQLRNEYGRDHMYLHTMFAYAIEGAIQGKNMNALNKEEKENLKTFVKQLKTQ